MSWWRHEKTKGGGYWLLSSEVSAWLPIIMIVLSLIAATL